MRLTQERLREVLTYNRRTGVFRRKKGGRVAGHLSFRGAVTVNVDGKNYYAHRLAWLYVFGAWPALQIDHINRNKSDNRIVNLREANDSQQRMNSAACWGKSGVRGVVRAAGRRRSPWAAKVKLRGRVVYCRYFRTKKAASSAYESTRRRLFGEWAPA